VRAPWPCPSSVRFAPAFASSNGTAPHHIGHATSRSPARLLVLAHPLSHLWHAVDRSRVRCPFCLPSLTYHVLVMNVRASVHSLLVAGLMVNASHEAMDEHADFARTRAAHQTVASYFATSEGQIGLERPAGLLLRYARREVRGHLRLHSRFSASVPKTLVRALLMEC
jgi:hypothetical protein